MHPYPGTSAQHPLPICLFVCLFLLSSFIYLQRSASIPDGPDSSWGLELQLWGGPVWSPALVLPNGWVALDASLNCSGPWFPHLSKGNSGGTWSNEMGSLGSNESLELYSPSPKYLQPCLHSQYPCCWASVSPPLGLSGGSPAPLRALLSPQSPGSDQWLPSGGAGAHEPGCGQVLEELLAWSRGLVSENGSVFIVFGEDDSSAL